MSSRDINQLKEPFRHQIKILIEKANEQGIPAFVTDTTRTLAEQKELLRKGFSQTLKSKHLIGEAADIAFQINGKLSYDSKLYIRLYTIAKDLSFVIWPYKDLDWNWDKPHFQYDKNKKVVDNDDMYKEKYEQEKSDHGETITQSKDRYIKWQHWMDRAKGAEKDKQKYYDNWQKSIEEFQKMRTKFNNCQKDLAQNLIVIERVKLALGL